MISLLVVNYRSAALAIDAIRSARAATAGNLHVVTVDNSVDRREADSLRPHTDILLTPDKNLGYAGAINAGRPECRGDMMIVSNPDVIYDAGSIDDLARALDERDTAVASPALFWDDAFTWMLPPSDTHTLPEKLGAAMASRFSWLAARRDRRRTAARIHFWSLRETTSVRAVSGAVMAIRLADFDALGGFDERFHLYFEESDFLRRVVGAKKKVLYVPRARCRHMYNQSAAADSHNAARAYAESEMLFLSKWYGGTTAKLIKSIERPRHFAEPERIDGPIELTNTNVVVEASPLRSFDTAAGIFPQSKRVDLPAEVWDSYRAPVVYLRVVDRGRGAAVRTYERYRS